MSEFRVSPISLAVPTSGKYGPELAPLSRVRSLGSQPFLAHSQSPEPGVAVLCQGLRLPYGATCNSPAATPLLSLQVPRCCCDSFTFVPPEVAALPSSLDRCYGSCCYSGQSQCDPRNRPMFWGPFRVAQGSSLCCLFAC